MLPKWQHSRNRLIYQVFLVNRQLLTAKLAALRAAALPRRIKTSFNINNLEYYSRVARVLRSLSTETAAGGFRNGKEVACDTGLVASALF